MKVIGGGAWLEEERSRKPLRIATTAGVDGVWRDYEMAFGSGETKPWASSSPGRMRRGQEADAERLAILMKALTGKGPKVVQHGRQDRNRMRQEHLDGFMRCVELADVIERGLRRWAAGRAPGSDSGASRHVAKIGTTSPI